MFYSEEIIEEVRSRNDIVDVISGYVSLKQRGSTYSACCPFHQEKTPSFHVSRSRQMYKCFGCGEAGNVITFIMQYENMTFPEALQLLANRAGVALPEHAMSGSERKQKDYKSMLFEMNKTAAGYFHYLLTQKAGEKGLAYLTGRGITSGTIKNFALGYADMTKDDLYQYLKHKGYQDQQMKDSGLVEIDEVRGGRDKFWNRVMFPILDVNCHVIGFGGRVMGEGEPKYLNSKETAVFDKRRNLYGLYLAKRSKKKGIILCEGYMDVISMHQAGFDNAVASLGTAFTPEQAHLLKRYTDRIYLAYDSDGAGVRAALKAIEILKPYDISCRVIDMRPHKDPDEFIQTLGCEAFEERIQKAKGAIEFQMEQKALAYHLDDPEERTNFQHDIVNLLVSIEDPLARENYIDTAARTYQIDRELLKNHVNQIGYQMSETVKRETTQPLQRNVSRAKELEEKKQKPQKLLLTQFVNQPELIGKLEGMICKEDFYEPVFCAVANAVYEQYEQSRTVVPAAILSHFTDLEEQKLAADICQTTPEFSVTGEEYQKMISELVKKVKLDAIEHHLANASNMDIEALQKLNGQKRALDVWKMPV